MKSGNKIKIIWIIRKEKNKIFLILFFLLIFFLTKISIKPNSKKSEKNKRWINDEKLLLFFIKTNSTLSQFFSEFYLNTWFLNVIIGLLFEKFFWNTLMNNNCHFCLLLFFYFLRQNKENNLIKKVNIFETRFIKTESFLFWKKKTKRKFIRQIVGKKTNKK